MMGFRPQDSLEDYTASLCLASILVSKATHLVFHYTYEEFGTLDAIFTPTFFAYDALVYFAVRVCLQYSSHLRNLTRSRSNGIFNIRRILAAILFMFGASSSLVISFLATVEFSVYANIGGLCAWPTVVEVFCTPSYLLIFWEQWMTTKQTWFVCAIPAANAILTLCVHTIVKRRLWELPSNSLSRANIGLCAILVLAGIRLQSLARPWIAIALLCASCTAWNMLVTKVLQHARLPASESMSDLKPLRAPDSKIRPASTSFMRGALLSALIGLVSLRPHLLHDISVTVPASVIYSLMGATLERCPVGKPFPDISTDLRTDILSCQDKTCGYHHLLQSAETLSNWTSDAWSKGFGMFSPERQAEWIAWSANDNARSPEGYNFMFDESKISNLEHGLHPELHSPGHTGLSSVKIKHVVIILMESTPAHLFPFGPGSPFYTRAKASQASNKAYDNIDDITPLAKRLFTGQNASMDGQLGGITVPGAESTCSYTLKSLMASHCGTAPLPMDFMREAVADANLYQPCLPHILHALNNVRTTDRRSPLTDQHWNVLFGQPCDERWDRQMDIMEQIGFNLKDEVIVKSTLAKQDAPYPVPLHSRKAILGEVFYPENALAPYFRDFFRKSKRNNQRSFLSHLTCSTHFPWPLPADWTIRNYSEDDEINMALNAMANQDEWIEQLLDIIEDEGIRNETLVVMTGDHGISLGEGDLKQRLQPHNPHINNFQVPLLFHHPKMPFLTLPTNATSLNILPTIIDLLLNTDSGSTEAELDFLRKLLPSYEGQSLLRPLRHIIDHPAMPEPLPALNFALPTPGRGHVIVTSPDPTVPWRLSMPLCHHGTLAATNLRQDPQENAPVRTVDLHRLVREARHRWGHEAADWFEQAEKRAAIWIREISRRWGINQAAPPGEMVIKFST